MEIMMKHTVHFPNGVGVPKVQSANVMVIIEGVILLTEALCRY